MRTVGGVPQADAGETIAIVHARAQSNLDRDVAIQVAGAGAMHLLHAANAEGHDDVATAEAWARG